MNVYNSVAGFNEDDTDMTMINHSFMYSGTDESISSCIPIIRRQQAKTSASPEDNYANQDPLGPSQQVEQILNFYRQDLKQETNTQSDCNQRLITRLIDFLRPAYSSKENQMKDLDILYKEILDLQEVRFTEQKAKNDQLAIQVRYLKKSIITNPIEEDDRGSMMTNIYRMKTMIDYDQWLAVEEETKQLQQLVKTQHERINQLMELLSSIDHEKLIIQSTSPPPEEVEIQSLPEPPFEYPEPSAMPNADHIEEYVPTPDAAVPMKPEQLGCPFCDTKFPNDNENDMAYIEHLSLCFNNVNENF